MSVIFILRVEDTYLNVETIQNFSCAELALRQGAMALLCLQNVPSSILGSCSDNRIWAKPVFAGELLSIRVDSAARGTSGLTQYEVA